jgi:hypothetical protein
VASGGEGGLTHLLPVAVTLGPHAPVDDAEVALAQREVHVVLYLTVFKLNRRADTFDFVSTAMTTPTQKLYIFTFRDFTPAPYIIFKPLIRLKFCRWSITLKNE